MNKQSKTYLIEQLLYYLARNLLKYSVVNCGGKILHKYEVYSQNVIKLKEQTFNNHEVHSTCTDFASGNFNHLSF